MSLLTVLHPVVVTLQRTDIDADTVRRIQTSQHFTGTGDYNSRNFTFTTVPHTGTWVSWEEVGGGGSGRSQFTVRYSRDRRCCIL